MVIAFGEGRSTSPSVEIDQTNLTSFFCSSMWQWCQLAVVCLGAALAHGLLTDLKLDDRSLPGWRGEAELTGATDIIRYGKVNATPHISVVSPECL